MMNRIAVYVIMLMMLPASGMFGQIYGPEGLNIPGAFHGWGNPPTVNAFAGIQKTGGTFLVDTMLGTRRYKTRINVQASGGDATAGSYGWLFTSGPTTNYWANKWAGTGAVADSIQSYTFNSGSDNTITLANGFYYTVNFRDNGYQGSSAAWLKTSAVPVTIPSVTGTPATTPINTPVTITVTLSGAKCAEEKIYLRYSTDNFATSSAIEITSFDGSFQGTATIPGIATPGTTVKFYLLSTTKSSSSWGSQNVDLLTLNANNNGKNNFSYLVQPITSTGNGSWSNGAIWNTGSMPPSGASVTIASDVTLDTSITLNTLTINSGKIFTASDASARTLTIAAGGSINNSGTFTHGSGTVVFAGAGSVSGTAGFNNVTISNGVDFGSASTVNGTLKMNAGGYINTNAPAYATNGTLQYNTGGTYGRYLEWSDTTGKGYPYNVRVSNGTIVNLGNGGTAIARRIAGSLTIDSLSALTMDTTGAQMTAPLTVLGSVANYGRLIMSSGGVGADMYVKGNFTNYGIFTTNGRELLLNGATQQTFSTTSGSSTTLDYIAVSNNAGVYLDSLKGNALTISSRIRFTPGAGSLTMRATDTLVLGASAVVQGEAAGRYVIGLLKATKAVGAAASTFGDAGASLAAGADVGNVTMLRFSGSAGAVTVGGNTGINRKWHFTNDGAASFAGRLLTLSWVSSDDNGKDTSKAQIWKSTNGGTVWSSISGYQNSRSDTATITSFGTFTVSDSAHPFISNYTLTATLLYEAVWDGATTVADTITAALYAYPSPGSELASASALGTTAGVYTLTYAGISNGTNYYLRVTHRNGVETWSAQPVTFAGNTASINFTDSAAKTYGGNVVLKSGKYCFYSGDVNQDGLVDLNDLIAIDNDNAGFEYHLANDVNMDTLVDLNDMIVADNNNAAFVGEMVPATKKTLRNPVLQKAPAQE